MKKEFIRDDGIVRNCVANIAKMNIFEFMWYNWREAFSPVTEFVYFLKESVAGLSLFLANLAIFILFPITIPLHSYFVIRDAKKQVEKHNRIWGKNGD